MHEKLQVLDKDFNQHSAYIAFYIRLTKSFNLDICSKPAPFIKKIYGTTDPYGS